MSKIEEIIRKYAEASDPVGGFGAWLVSERDSAAKDAALAELWMALETAPAMDDAAVREKKLAALLSRLPVAAPTSRRILRYSWLPLAAAACIAAFFLFRSSPVPINLLPPDPIPEFLAETPVASKPILTQEKITFEIQQPTPAVEETSAVGPSAELPASVPGEDDPMASTTSPDPWKIMEEEDRQAASKTARRPSVSVAVFGAGGATAQANGAIRNHNQESSFFSASPGNATAVGERTIHDLPLNFGLSLRIPIAGRISLESGVTYSFLHSTARNLHYLGLPLYLQCDVIRGQRACLYVAGGGSLSYCIAGGGKEHPWQPAASVSAGAEWRIFGGVSIFGEASFNHYFGDGSPLETYYSINPNTPAFKAGLRFELL